MSPSSKRSQSAMPAKAAPCARMVLAALNRIAFGARPRSVISRSIQADATPPLAVFSTSTLST